MSIEPVFATELRPIACVLVSVFFEALMTVDFWILEPTTLIDPVLAALLRPIACVLVNVFFEALINVDFSIFEPSAMAVPAMIDIKTTAAKDTVFMMISP
jgi:hypothetical protein